MFEPNVRQDVQKYMRSVENRAGN